jgi:hypothetical protein
MKFFKKFEDTAKQYDVWARPEMAVTFRAEVMPGKTREQRTFRIKDVLANGRVELYDFNGEHREKEFEPINFLRENP